MPTSPNAELTEAHIALMSAPKFNVLTACGFLKGWCLTQTEAEGLVRSVVRNSRGKASAADFAIQPCGAK